VQHSQECGHARYGKLHVAELPEWDEHHPIDLVGYSLGAPTARYLQHLLIMEAFTDADGNRIQTNGDWVRSIITVQGCNNGSYCVHGVGLGLDSLQPKRLTILWFIFSFLYTTNWLLGDSAESFFSLSVGHWGW